MRYILIGIGVLALGILFGVLIDSSENAELIVSIIVMMLLLLMVLDNPLNAFLVIIFFISFIETWVEIPMGEGIPDLSFSRFGIASLVIILLARAAIGKIRLARVSWVDFCILLTMFGLLLSAPLASNPRGAVQTIITVHFTPLIAYFLAKNLVRNQADLNRLFIVIGLFGFAVALYAIYEHTTGNILFLPKEKVGLVLDTSYTASLRQLRGLLGKPGDFGRVLFVTIPISFYLFFEVKGFRYKPWLILMIVVQSIGIFFTYNRTSWYGLLLSLTIMQFFYPQFRKLYLIILFSALVVLWSTWGQVSDSAIVNERLNSKVSTLQGRESRWQAGYKMWLAKPIQGWGFGRYQEHSGKYRTDGVRRNFVAIENDYLHILVGSGLLGFTPYLLFLLISLLNSVKLYFRTLSPDWSGFVKPQTVALFWGIILSFALGSYTQIQTEAIVKILPFVVMGAVVGTHEFLLHRSRMSLNILQKAPSSV